MFKKHTISLFLLVVCLSYLLAGCTINLNIGAPSEDAVKETEGKTIFDHIFSGWNQKIMYESRASIYITNRTATDTAISSSDLETSLKLLDSYIIVLKSEEIQDKIREEYPNVEYTLSLEPISETEIFTLIATGENPEHLKEICNMAVSLLSEKLPQIIEGSSCEIVDYAKSTQEVETN